MKQIIIGNNLFEESLGVILRYYCPFENNLFSFIVESMLKYTYTLKK